MLAIFLDLETTGLDPSKHHVIDIAFKIIDMSSGEEKCTYQTIVQQPLFAWEKRDPASIEINGFTWEKVQTGKSSEVIREEIIALFREIGIERGKAMYICQNPSFDRAFFSQLIDVYAQEAFHWPYHWLDFASMYWALLVKRSRQEGIAIPQEMSFSKNAIGALYQLPPEETPHSALSGVNHLFLCYRTVVGI